MPTVRVVLHLGTPHPDRLSTALLISLLGHAGLLGAVLISTFLPDAAPSPSGAFFVRLAGPPSPPPGEATRSAAREPSPPAPAAPERTPPPDPHAHESAPPRPAPTKASLPPKRIVPPTPARAPSPAPESSERAAAPEDGQGTAAAGDGERGGPPGAPGDGVGGTSFGEGDFQYAWYQAAIEARLRSEWRRPVAAAEGTQTATVSFTIQRTGAVRDVLIASPSGNSALDLSIIRAVYDSNPLPALPRSWSGEDVHVSMEFRLTAGAF